MAGKSAISNHLFPSTSKMNVFFTHSLRTALLSAGICLNIQAQQPLSKPLTRLAPGVGLGLQNRTSEENVLEIKPQTKAVLRSGAVCNYVINGNFDSQNTIPSGFFGNIYINGYPANQPGLRDELSNWQSTNLTSPDYFASNAPANSSTNPASSFVGRYTPFNYVAGAINGGIGLFTYEAAPNTSYAEYVTQQLAEPLDGNEYYYASMQVRSAPYAQYATHIGLDVTVLNPIDITTNANYTSARLYTPSGCGIQSGGFISSEQWTRVSGVFKGITGAQYLNVGNFQPSSYQYIKNAVYNQEAYQYIDDIQIYKLPKAGGPLTIQCGTPVTLGEGCAIPDATYTWSAPGVSGLPTNSQTLQLTVTPTVTTIYTLTINLPNNAGTYVSSGTVTVDCNCDRQMYAIDIENDYYCDQQVLYYVPVFDPGPYDPAYANTLGFTFVSSGDIVTNYVTISPISGRPCVVIAPLQGRPTINFGIEITYHYANGCTVSYYESGWDASYCQGQRTYTATPNPASSQLTIEAEAATKSNSLQRSSDEIVEAQLYNSFGKLVKQGRSSSGSLSLDVHDLPDGIYHLRSGSGKNTSSKTIEVRH